MAAAATLATFADFRLIKGRKQAQLVFEVPIEKADEALAALGGLPRSDGERWCGIALVNSVSPDTDTGRDGAPPPPASPVSAEAKDRDKPRRSWHTMPRSQQAGIRCAEPRFQDWLLKRQTGLMNWLPEQDREDFAAGWVREICKVDSRMRLDVETGGAGDVWDRLDARYRQETGMETERR